LAWESSKEPSRLRYERSEKGRSVQRRATQKYLAKTRSFRIFLAKDDPLTEEIVKAAEQEGCRPSELFLYLFRKWLVEHRTPD
jgi:hypothetical protein